MEQHFYNTIAINDLGRKTLLKSVNSVFDMIMGTGVNGSLQIMMEMWKRWNIMEKSFPNEMKSRGFYEVKEGVKDNLPGYYYRDDGFKIWHAIRNYVKSVVSRPDVYGVPNPGNLQT
jgi:arachidonate 5-lipoxygenase